MVESDEILKFLEEIGPHDNTCRKEMEVAAASGSSLILHADLNDQDDKYGYMWEWWLERGGDYIDGGFMPSGGDAGLADLAAVIQAAIRKSLGSP